jgi:MFS family permease
MAVAALPSVEGRGQEEYLSDISLRSRVGLNAANFFLAEVTGVVMPFLAAFLSSCGWRDDAIGIAAGTAGLGVFLMQSPAGFLVDRVRQRRALLAGASVLVGVCYGLLPLVPARWQVIDPLLFLAGAGHAFFMPLLGALALALVGHARLNRTMGVNQGWNHAGNLASALVAIALVAAFGTPSVFQAVTVVSVLAAGSVFLVREDEGRASGRRHDGEARSAGLFALLRDRRIGILFLCTALFHLANAPVMPLVGRYIDYLGGSGVQVAAVVLVAQAVMIPVALAAGRLCDTWGRKPVFTVAFLVLPLRIFLYSLSSDPWMLVALQALDGIGAGIYGVVIVAMCADLTRDKGGFNGLQGLIATALSAGGVLGPLVAGFIVQHLGFNMAFYVFTGVAALAALVFVGLMPETRPEPLKESRHSDCVGGNQATGSDGRGRCEAVEKLQGKK